MTLVPFEAADSIGDRFLALLGKHGINPPIASALEDELLSVTQLVEVMKNPQLASRPDQVNILRSAAGILDLAAKVLAIEPLPDFEIMIPHLRLISEKKASVASLGQSIASGPQDDTARKFAELYIGSLVAHFGFDVELDSPTNAKGDNPDVIFRPYDWPDQRWAMAIKTISSRHGQTIYDRIKEAAVQIDSPLCHADRGMVVINVKSSLDHDALWNVSFPDLQAAISALDHQLQGLIEKAQRDRPQTEWEDIFAGKAVRPVLFLAQSVVRIPTPAGLSTPTPLKLMMAYGAQGALDPIGQKIALWLNEFMQAIRMGIPGSGGKFPR